jgi:predicted Zn-dependent protease
MGPRAQTAQVRAILTLWEDDWPGIERVRLARQLARSATAAQKAEFAHFLIRTGASADAAALLAPIVGSGADSRNVQHAGLYAHALVELGRLDDAKRWIDQVLAIDQDNVDALRATVRLDVRQRDFRVAINDALKIVTLVPNSAEDRLLLSRTYLAAGEEREAERTLWRAFQEIPGDRHVFVALQQYLIASGDNDGRSRVQREFAERRRASNLRDLI